MHGTRPRGGELGGAFNEMHPLRWVPSGATSLLDVGCNVGAFLKLCGEFFPDIGLAGVDVNHRALDAARRDLPRADLRAAGAQDLPFADRSFDCLTCIEVLEHIPGDLRARSLDEMRRVLRPGGRLAIRVPHAGAFAFLDSNNFRFRFPRLYRRLIGRGLRDAGYRDPASAVVWHHHFTGRELRGLAGDGWEVESSRRGGLLVFPLVDLARWPFYRAGLGDHAISRILERVADLDLGIDYGPASFDVLLVLRRA